ncbi:hypothetical protein VOLCADRAFT_75495 [Volvox carteri f. nagariensis]|uniref:HMG box domain-containing protein n=1 Tax=Volvox carteri f. nagariensis TaxID=3068 RepID=D8U2B0_VOLCA|nr:uncharacterized protein VOLCADRAFT_75495 [Volvox carteri f. nagariensis]EFJ46102.1 hypothetical protein VOLCADRAFT_75495 [Volvox carteri f. nagariensis]|eukprot:XP_002952852.1 hypothetical protein VOLCADRAFT_75495 [Volvox carteri f. nagariensis]
MRSLLRFTPAPQRTVCVHAARQAKDAASVLKKATVKQAVLDAKPEVKRPPSAFNLFVKDMFPAIKKENQGLAFADVSKKVKEMWLSSPADVRAPYEHEAAKLKSIAAARRAEVKAAEKAKARPPGAYILFVKKNRPAVVAANPNKSVTEVGKLMGALWKQLSPEEQQKYKDEAKTLLSAWKDSRAVPA